MKKLTQLSLVFIMIAILGQSCKKKGGPEPGEGEATETGISKLSLSASADEIQVGHPISFSVEADEVPITDATIYVNGNAIEGYTYQFEKKGSYEIVAKKEKHQDSQGLEIKAFKFEIYVAGVEAIGSAENLSQVPKFWINGKDTTLIEGDFQLLEPRIYVQGDDIYITGNKFPSPSISEAVYWRNGEETLLSSNGTSNDIAVSGNDVFVAGAKQDEAALRAVYWENSVERTLETPEGFSSLASSIQVIGEDVYISGRLIAANSESKAVYWKNGVLSELGSGTGNAGANTIFVSGDNIYVGGSEAGLAKYWTTSSETVLSADETTGDVNSIFVDENVVHAVGRTGQTAAYWKDGESVSLSGAQGGYSSAQSVLVLDGNVFIAGQVFENMRIPAYWVDGLLTELEVEDAKGSSSASDIFVVKKY